MMRGTRGEEREERGRTDSKISKKKKKKNNDKTGFSFGLDRSRVELAGRAWRGVAWRSVAWRAWRWGRDVSKLLI